MNQIQNTLEQVYKEYITFKEYTENNKKTKEQLREEVTKKIMNGADPLEAFYDITIDKQIELSEQDKLATRLRHYYDAYKDLVEVPEYIIKELENLQIKYIFTVKNNKRETVEKELYDEHKKQFLEVNKQAQEEDLE